MWTAAVVKNEWGMGGDVPPGPVDQSGLFADKSSLLTGQ